MTIQDRIASGQEFRVIPRMGQNGFSVLLGPDDDFVRIAHCDFASDADFVLKAVSHEQG